MVNDDDRGRIEVDKTNGGMEGDNESKNGGLLEDGSSESDEDFGDMHENGVDRNGENERITALRGQGKGRRNWKRAITFERMSNAR